LQRYRERLEVVKMYEDVYKPPAEDKQGFSEEGLMPDEWTGADDDYRACRNG